MKKEKMMVLFVVLVLGLTGCRSTVKSEGGTLNVIAAASLTEVFTALKEDFEKENQSLSINLTFAGSQSCVAQIKESDRFDVFASADERYMTEVIDQGYVHSQEEILFAKNQLAIVASKDSNIVNLHNLLQEDYTVVIADDSVPIGQYTLDLLSGLEEQETYNGIYERLMKNVVSKEISVKMVWSKIQINEIDVGIVYQTDIIKESSIHQIDIPSELNVSTSYYIAPLMRSNNKAVANQWIDYIESEKGKAILVEYGYDI
ncbi:molybdate transport system substrate-binding protein [Natranaerovirga hydrolytica]|uniref:Molybdate transport system substrate-binding protein n=1 Tax=Natranaerovirga hydrolytica TaxID=680378 RepID=A0A4R1MK42_9FIRM|nr:molybdate ABC transporter substrate-binding protein [Natranaerovirga hydrolytica]TCK92907.1 molybdate transport system substrate-binding protein [Natranaerovirga hydrolytica]